MIPKNKLSTNLQNVLLSYGFSIIFFLLLIFFSVSTENFFTVTNILTVLASAAPYILMATGVTLVIMTGNIDLSMGAILFLSMVVGNSLMLNRGVSPWIAIPLMFVIGALMGAINGFIITVIKIDPLITTMGMLFAMRGFTLFLTNEQMMNLAPPLLNFGKLPYFQELVIGISLLGLIIMHFVVTRTPFGRQVMAIGNNSEIASRLGVRVKRTLFITYVLSGLMVTIGGLLQLMQVSVIVSREGQGYEFILISAAVIGGISMFGGEGNMIPGLILGGTTLVVLENGLTNLGVTPYLYPLVRGGIIFLAMYADSLKSRISIRRTFFSEVAEKVTAATNSDPPVTG
jgi:ribose/xylose/arabinose/galactoside ABC-type transport system permease subunit